MRRVIVVVCAILLGLAAAGPVKKENGKRFEEHGPKTKMPLMEEKTTNNRDNNGHEATTEVSVIEETTTENTKDFKADFSPMNIASCLIDSVPKIIKCFKPNTTNMNMQFKSGRWPDVVLDDLPYIDDFWQWPEDWQNGRFWESSKLWLSGQKFWEPSEEIWQPNAFWQSYEEFWKSIAGVGQSSEELGWGNEDSWQSSEEYWQSSEEYWPCSEEEQQPRKENSVEKEGSGPKENHIAIQFSLHLPLDCIAEAVVDFGKCLLDGKSL